MSLRAAAGLAGPRDVGDGRDAFPGGAMEWAVLRRILSYTRPYAVKRNVVFALTLVRAVQKPAMAWALAAVINGPILAGDARGTAWGAAGFLALAVFTELTFHFRQRLALELGESVVHDLRDAVYRQLQRQPMDFFNRTRQGHVLSRVITDIEAVRRGVQNVFFFSLLLVGQMIGAAVLMWHYSPWLFATLLLVGPPVWWTSRHFHPRLVGLSRATAESQSRLTGMVAESVKGMRLIQACSRQDQGDERYGTLVERHAGNNLRLAGDSALYVPLLDLNSQLFTAAMLVVGGYGALHGIAGLDMGSLVAFLFLPNLFFQSLQHLATLSTQAIASVAGAERVFQLIDEQPVWKDAPEAVALPQTGAVHSAARSGARVVFRNVSFGYGPARPVLCDVSFSVEPGQTVALVGPTGSGKTTLVSLLAKLYPVSSGRIEIDGHDIAGLTGSSIRAQMGIVPQANFLFSGTVMDNVRFGCPSASDEEIRAAARRLDCLDLVEAMPQGFLTEVGERGGALSLGQRQLVCFLRALLAEPRLLILDEATSSVDTITEARLQRALERLLESRTSFVVAHRLSTIRRADLILVLDRGAIVDRGSHLELLARPGLYRSLYRQFALSDLS